MEEYQGLFPTVAFQLLGRPISFPRSAWNE